MKKPFYSLDEVSAKYDIDPWIIRMWVNRFDIQEFQIGRNGGVKLSPQGVEQVGMIHRLLRVEGMSAKDIRKYLGTGGACSFAES
jgi:DNA-binding transcriptional MerR regulator